MEKKYLPVLLSLFLLAICSVSAENFFAARDLFNNIACNIICVIEYMILAICAVTVVLSGARYMSSDDPIVRIDMRKNFIYAIVGLLFVFAGIPAMNALVNQTKSPFYCISCSPDAQAFKLVAETISCHIICLVQLVAGMVLVLIVVFAGLRYTISGDDPTTRHDMLNWIKNAIAGILIIILAVPVLNYITEGSGTPLECDCISNGDIAEQIVTVLGNLLCLFTLIAPPICALAVTYGGLQYITSADDPGARDNAKKVIISALIGMILVMLAVPLVNLVLTSSFTQVTLNNNCLQVPAVTEITRIMCSFWCFLSYIAPAICALVVIYGGLRYISSGDDPGARKTAKTIIISAFVGMILVYISIPIVNLVLTSTFKQVACDRCPDSQSVKDIVDILCKFVCLISSVAPAIAALVIIYGGLRYVTSGEDPGARNAAKMIIICAIIGLIIILITVPIVNFVLTGLLPGFECNCAGSGSGTLSSDSAPVAKAAVGISTAPPETQKTATVKKDAVTYFDASKSVPKDSIMEYSWNFGDGTALQVGATVEHQYTKTGTYDATLTVRGKNGKTSTDKVTVTVTEEAKDNKCDNKCGLACGSGSNAKTCKASERCKDCTDGCCCTYDPYCTANAGIELGLPGEDRYAQVLASGWVVALLDNGYADRDGTDKRCESCDIDWGDGTINTVSGGETQTIKFYTSNGEHKVSYKCKCDYAVVSGTASITTSAPELKKDSKITFLFIAISEDPTTQKFKDRVSGVYKTIAENTPMKDCQDLIESQIADNQCPISIPTDSKQCTQAVDDAIRDALRECAKNSNKKHDYIIGLDSIDTCGQDVGLNWPQGVVYLDENYAQGKSALHELGHVWGLNDEYYDACRCFSSTSNQNANCLDSSLKGNDPAATEWTGYCAGGTICPENKQVTCKGNENSLKGRCAMSYEDADRPRAYCDKCWAFLAKLPMLKCPDK